MARQIEYLPLRRQLAQKRTGLRRVDINVAASYDTPAQQVIDTLVAAAAEDVRKGKGVNVPTHLQSPLFKGYRYPHDYENHYVDQQYLPDDLVGTVYYQPAPNKAEQAAAEYWSRIKKKS